MYDRATHIHLENLKWPTKKPMSPSWILSWQFHNKVYPFHHRHLIINSANLLGYDIFAAWLTLTNSINATYLMAILQFDLFWNVLKFMLN